MVLTDIYGFTDIRMVFNGSWTIEQYKDKDMVYTARILQNGDVFVTVETNDKFPKLVTGYKVSSSN